MWDKKQSFCLKFTIEGAKKMNSKRGSGEDGRESKEDLIRVNERSCCKYVSRCCVPNLLFLISSSCYTRSHPSKRREIIIQTMRHEAQGEKRKIVVLGNACECCWKSKQRIRVERNLPLTKHRRWDLNNWRTKSRKKVKVHSSSTEQGKSKQSFENWIRFQSQMLQIHFMNYWNPRSISTSTSTEPMTQLGFYANPPTMNIESLFWRSKHSRREK